MRTLLSLLTFFLAVFYIEAQNTRVITGAVIDKNGNPIPNALVEATGGAESVMTEADGSFTMEVPVWLKSLTVKYAGLGTKKYKLNNFSYALIEMPAKKESCWFANAVTSINYTPQHYAYDSKDRYFCRLGVMGGHLGTWGWYGKILTVASTDYPIRPSITGGVVKSVIKHLYAYLGAGYTGVCYIENSYQFRTESGVMGDIGLISKFNRVNVNIGYSYAFRKGKFSDYYYNHSVQFSAGYCF